MAPAGSLARPSWWILLAAAGVLAGCNADSLAALPDGGGDGGDTRDAGGQPGDGGAEDGGRGPGGPPYPVVLAHGFFGFDDFAGAGFLTYFHGVKDHLADGGEAQVFVTVVDPFNSSAVRGGQLIEQIEDILAETGHARVNLIGHSQGGLDARVVAHDRPDLVASVTTIATPHYGSPLADIVLGLVQDDRAADLVDALVRVIGAPLYDAVGNESSVVEGLRQFSEPGITAFNAAYPDDPSVAYYSVTGRTDFHLGGPDCAVSDAPDFVADWRLELDPVDPMLDLAEVLLDGGLGDPYPNDGMVRVVDARWGRFLGCVPADHLDEVGQIGGDRPGLFNDWRHLEFFSDLVRFLRAEGY